MNLTLKMMLILEVIMVRNPDGSLVDLDQLIARVDYPVTKPAIQFTLRALVKNGMLEKTHDKRRGKNRAMYQATTLAYQCYKIGDADHEKSCYTP